MQYIYVHSTAFTHIMVKKRLKQNATNLNINNSLYSYMYVYICNILTLITALYYTSLSLCSSYLHLHYMYAKRSVC